MKRDELEVGKEVVYKGNTTNDPNIRDFTVGKSYTLCQQDAIDKVRNEFYVLDDVQEKNYAPCYYSACFELKPSKEKRNHVHADLIRQWLDDESLVIQYLSINDGKWHDLIDPNWCEQVIYRIKPDYISFISNDDLRALANQYGIGFINEKLEKFAYDLISQYESSKVKDTRND